MTAAASRTDPETGVVDRVEFIGAGERILVGTHLPPAQPTAGVLLCSSLNHDLVRNYRREVLLARALAEAGYAVQRFQHRGTGNSDGDATEISRASLLEDAHAAMRHLLEQCDVRRWVFIGTRFGALVAGAMGAEHSGAPLVLVEPVLDPNLWIREGMRTTLMQSMLAGGVRRTTEDMFEELATRGWIDILGYPVGRTLQESCDGWTLTPLVAGEQRDVLLLQLGRGRLRSQYETIQADLVSAGSTVTTVQLGEQEAWWVTDERELERIGRTDQDDDAEMGPTDEPPWSMALNGAVTSWLRTLTWAVTT